MVSWDILNGDIEVDKTIATTYTADLYQRSKHPVDVAWNHIRCQENVDLSEELKTITTPGLFIHGEKDPLIALKDGIATQAITTNSTMVIIPNMGHVFFQLECETLINHHLLKHFSCND
jgi:pimeloyl-ACP methyl ester carboxylesterase